MNAPSNDLLLVAGKVLTILLQIIMAIGAAALAIAVIAVLVFGQEFVAAVNAGSEVPLGDIPIVLLAGLLAMAFMVLAALFIFFGNLRRIIDTVGAGDPFVPANARRLNTMAWLLLANQVLAWPIAALALVIAEQAPPEVFAEIDLTLKADAFSLTGFLMALTLFILARVFRHGAAMREDLEGTV